MDFSKDGENMYQEEDRVVFNVGTMFINGGSGEKGGENELKKGPWTPQEDAILTKYVMENGERGWNDLRRKFGLMRCGKSCRRRWVNNLKSDLKKGDFTLEEENKILRLHAQYGNRWSLLALHFPGRTDNEIKNYWNLRSKRHIRAGVPIYPPKIIQEMQQHHLHQQQQQQQSLQSQLQNLPSFSTLSSSPSEYEINDYYNLISSYSHQTNMVSSLSSSNDDQNSYFNFTNPMDYNTLHSDNKVGDTMSLSPPYQNLPSPKSPYTPFFDQTQIATLGMSSLPNMNDFFSPENFEIEIPSIQSSFQPTTLTTSWSNNVNDQNNFVSSNGEVDNYGLLEDVLKQSTTFFSSRLPFNESEYDQSQGRIVHDDDSVTIMQNLKNDTLFGNNVTPLDESSSTSIFPSICSVESQAHMFDDLNNMIEDDLWSCPDDFPLAETTQPATFSNGTMAAPILNNQVAPISIEKDHDSTAYIVPSFIATIQPDTNHDLAQEVMGSPIAITPFEQDLDWALGYFPNFS